MKATEKQKEAIPEKEKAIAPKFKYKLSKKGSTVIFEGNEASYVFWKANGTFQSIGKSPSVGTSLALDLEYGVTSTHITDQITNVLEFSEGCVKFETKDGLYELIAT